MTAAPDTVRSATSYGLHPEDIRAIRKALNYSQTRFAALFDVRREEVSHWEHGRFRLSRHNAKLLLRFLLRADRDGLLREIGLDLQRDGPNLRVLSCD